MLVTSDVIINKAYKEGYAVAAINTQGGNYDIIRSICDAAEECRSPVILAHYPITGTYSGDDWFYEVAKWCAGKVTVPVAVHLDHGDSFETAKECIDIGFTSVMYDGSALPVKKNATNTNKVIDYAHSRNIPVEAEVGPLSASNLDGANTAKHNIVSVGEVEEFLSLCRPDFLAVGIGNAHGFYTSSPNIRLDVLEQCRRITDIPLVLHGCTGMPDDTVRKAIATGVAKINFGTLVRHEYVRHYADGINKLDHNGHSYKISAYAYSQMKKVISGIIALSGSENKGY